MVRSHRNYHFSELSVGFRNLPKPALSLCYNGTRSFLGVAQSYPNKPKYYTYTTPEKG